MGTDIHGVIQVYKNGEWFTVANGYEMQNYDIFGMLAGVRDHYSLNEFERKGLPEDFEMDADTCQHIFKINTLFEDEIASKLNPRYVISNRQSTKEKYLSLGAGGDPTSFLDAYGKIEKRYSDYKEEDEEEDEDDKKLRERLKTTKCTAYYVGEHSHTWFIYEDLKNLIDLDRMAVLSGIISEADYKKWDKISEPKHITHLDFKTKLIVARMMINGNPTFASDIADGIGAIWTPEKYEAHLMKDVPAEETSGFHLNAELNKIEIPRDLHIDVSWSKSYSKLVDRYFVEFVKNLGTMAEIYGNENVRWVIGFDS